MNYKNIVYAIFPISLCLVFIGGIRDGHMMAFIIVGGLCIAPQIKNHWIRIYYLWSLVVGCYVYGVFVATLSVNFHRFHLINMDSFLKLSIGMLVCILAFRIPKKDHVFVFNSLCGFILFQCGIYIFQKIGLDMVQELKYPVLNYQTIPMEPSATFGNPGFFSNCIAIVFPLFLRRKWYYCLPLLIFVLFSLKSSAAIVAIAVTLVYLSFRVWKSKKWILLSVTFILGIVFFSYFDPFSIDKIRRYVWPLIISAWKTWILTGNGLGAFAMIPAFADIEHAHNEYLEILFEGGFIAGVAVVGFLICLFKKIIKETNFNNLLLFLCLASTAIISFFHYPLHLAPSAFITCVLLGLYSRLNEEERMLNKLNNKTLDSRKGLRYAS